MKEKFDKKKAALNFMMDSFKYTAMTAFSGATIECFKSFGSVFNATSMFEIAFKGFFMPIKIFRGFAVGTGIGVLFAPSRAAGNYCQNRIEQLKNSNNANSDKQIAKFTNIQTSLQGGEVGAIIGGLTNFASKIPEDFVGLKRPVAGWVAGVILITAHSQAKESSWVKSIEKPRKSDGPVRE
jgi:hypothetical protein